MNMTVLRSPTMLISTNYYMKRPMRPMFKKKIIILSSLTAIKSNMRSGFLAAEE